MRSSARQVVLIAALLAFSGCVTSHYRNEKGCDCTRRYFTPCGLSWKTCSKTPSAAVEPAKDQGQELKVTALAPSPSLRQTTPAKTMEQSIKATTQALRR